MRLRRLRIERYGCFDRADLAFSTQPGQINLVVAPNGAGKSVLRQAFHDLLFDIPLQSAMKFRYDYPGMALHAEALAADGAAFGFGWVRQGKPQRVTDDPARYAALRQEVTPQQLEQLFALDTAGLRKGGTDLKGGATLAGALLAGTGELAPAKAVRAEIEARRRANWGQSKSKPPLNAAIAALENARRSARAAVQKPQQRESQQRELEAKAAEHVAAKQDHENGRAATRRLHRVALTRGHLNEAAEAEAWLQTHPDAPSLPPGLDQQLAEARGFAATAQATVAAAQQALAAAIEAASRIERDAVAGVCSDRLARLPGMLGEAEKAARDLAALRTERTTKLGLIRTVLRDIGTTLPEEQAGTLVPPVAVSAEARAAITEHAGLRKALELAATRDTKATQARLDAAQIPSETAVLPSGLAALLQEVRADRNPGQHRAELADALHRAQAGLRAAVALVPGWTGSAEGLRALTPPADAAFERLDATRLAAASGHRGADADQVRLATERDHALRALAALHEQPLPDAAAIAAARAARDDGWRLVLRHGFSTEPPDLAAERSYAGTEPLPLVYERHVRAADELSDRRIAELDRVKEADRLDQQLAELDRALELAASDRVQAAAAQAAADEAWCAAGAPFGLGRDATMADLRLTLAARARVVEAMRLAEVAQASWDGLAATHAEWIKRLAPLLGLAQQPLAALMAAADARVAAAQAADLAVVRQQAQLAAAQQEARQAAGELEVARRELDRWEQAWTGLLARLGRPATERPEVTALVLERLTALDQHDREATALAARITGIEADLDRFAAFVDALANVMAEAAGPDPAATAGTLITRTRRAADLDGQWTQAHGNLSRSRGTLAEQEARQSDAQRRLEAVVAAAGARTPEDADARIAAGRDHARYTAMRDAALAGLREHGGGQTRAALQAEADAVPADELVARRDAAEAAATEAGARAEAAAVRVDQLRTAFEQEADATAAVATRADYEAAGAVYARRLEEQLVLHVAGTMLAQAMQSVEQQYGGSGLLRVSQAFAAVTGGAYGIEAAADTDALHAVERAFPQERKELHELSEGTRDQLYLALRMVALREHCAAASPLPFLADDILQTFDDDRAAAALQALVELSEHMQVIVLTHHPHLARLAQATQPDRATILSL